jgi:hypothetical protein
VLKIKKRFIVNEKNEPVEVVLDLKTFRRIENFLEDHLLGKILDAEENAPLISLEESLKRYSRLRKRR